MRNFCHADRAHRRGPPGQYQRDGVPVQLAHASDDAKAQAAQIAADLKESGQEVAADSEMVALVSYLQRLGKQPEPEKRDGISQKE